MLNVVNYVFNFVSVGSNILVFFFFFKSMMDGLEILAPFLCSMLNIYLPIIQNLS